MSTSSSEAIRASPSVKPESAAAPPTRDIFGSSSRASFAYFDPAECCWKTSQDTFLLGLEKFSETWPDSGSMQSGCVYELVISERPTCESGSSSWPTATACSENSLRGSGQDPERRKAGGHAVNLQDVVSTWLTPHGMHGTDHTDKTGRGGEFAKQATGWATPNAHDGRRPGSDATSTQGANLKRDAEIWQTPATDSFRSRGGDRKDEMGLDQQARAMFPTPAARDYRTPGKESSKDRRGNLSGPSLEKFVEHSLPDLATHDGQTSSPSGLTSRRRLNPRFVEWLMGFPPSWTELSD